MMTSFNAQKGNYIPTNKDRAKISRSSWNKEQKMRHLLNFKAINFLMYALTKSECEKVYNCKSSKEMWDMLSLTYKGTTRIRDSKISMLVRQYELFKMEDNETIYLMFDRFQIIINNLRSLGKTYDNYNHITKILRSLPIRWRP
ncbi:hypothetical protein CR513_39968, partial [Mucuna pruriens]